MNKNFLVELGTEELPPKALQTLIASFKAGVIQGLEAANLKHGTVKAYATPRRLALWIEALVSQGESRSVEKRGPIKAAALNAAGEPTPAALGFAKTCGVEFPALTWLKTEKGEYLGYQGQEAGVNAEAVLPGIIQKALEGLPIPKVMRWGSHSFGFVRPVSWLVMIHGTEVIPAELFGVKSGRLSLGHRIHHPEPLVLNSADEYVDTLRQAFVVVDAEERGQRIQTAMNALAKNLKATVVFDADLLSEVNSIVEWPVPMVCGFDPAFLSVPKEALISAMQGHQKCFALEDSAGKLLPQFITVANLESQDPAVVIAGNERVMRARLSDAAFFYAKDLKQPLDALLPRLETVTFQAKLGSVADKARRVEKLVQLMGGDASALRAAHLCKADLMSEMVYEFLELQGIMGEYYAQAQGESPEVAKALFEQYLPRFSGDVLPQTLAGKYLALADRLDTVSGIFSIGLKPTGSKDPFALRRAMIGVIRLLTEGQLNLDLWELFRSAGELSSDLKTFAIDRLKNFWVEEKGYDLVWVESLIDGLCESNAACLMDIEARLNAVLAFAKLPQAESLLASVKRVSNILKKNGVQKSDLAVETSRLEDPAEQALFKVFQSLQPTLLAQFDGKHYSAYLETLTALRAPLETFFEAVMVMAEDLAIRNNRLALLGHIQQGFERVGLG